jgi:hypothetical protein
MIIKQVSVFLENKSGRLVEVLSVLGEHKIYIKALTIADTSEFGILRMLVSRPEEALNILKSRDFSVTLTDVIAIAAPAEAASFSRALKILSDKAISIEYLYAFSMKTKAAIIIRTENIEKAISAIRENNMDLLNAEELNEI